MSKRAIPNTDKLTELLLEEIAPNFAYPPTPNISADVRRQLTDRSRRPGQPLRRAGWAIVILFIIFAGLLTVPQVRAAVVEFLQLGAIRIFLVEPTPTATLTPATSTGTAPDTATPLPTATPLASILDLAGETSLEQAQAVVDFPIRLPGYPKTLGPPDRVFVQELGGAAVVLVWLDPNRSEQARLSLHQLGVGSAVQKTQPEIITESTVNGQVALWVNGPHLFQFQNGQYDIARLVDGNVLIWVEEGITYRLESQLNLDEVVKIAESLR